MRLKSVFTTAITSFLVAASLGVPHATAQESSLPHTVDLAPAQQG